MTLITAADADKLRLHFSQSLEGSVRLRLVTHADACALCEQAEALLAELAALSEYITLHRETDSGGALPEIRVDGKTSGIVRFVGLPSGYEFPAFIDSILDAANGATSLDTRSVERLRALGEQVHIQVFTTPT